MKPAFSLDNYSFIPYEFEPSLKTNGQNYTDIPHNSTLALEKFTIATWFKTNLSNQILPSNIVNKGGFGDETPGMNMNYGIWLEKMEQFLEDLKLLKLEKILESILLQKFLMINGIMFC